MRYATEKASMSAIVPENELETRLLRNLIDERLQDLVGREGAGPLPSTTGEPWPIQQIDLDKEDTEPGWWPVQVHAVPPDEMEAADALFTMRTARVEVGLAIDPPWAGGRGNPQLIWRAGTTDTGPSTTPLWLFLSRPCWK